MRERIETPRLRLTALAPDALASMVPWLEDTLAPEWTFAQLEAAVRGGHGVLIDDAEGEPIGLAVALRDAPAPRSACVSFLAIDPQRRFRGLGGEAGLALEAHLRGSGSAKVYVPVPDGRGLAVYFWLRQGFRPLLHGESPGAVVGLDGKPMRGIWMVSGDPTPPPASPSGITHSA